MAKKPSGPSPEAMTQEAQEAVRAAYDALSEWRDEMQAANERYSDKVFDQLGSASEAMGMSADMVNQTRSQVQNAAKMQSEMMNKMMEAWEKQLDQPGATMSFSPEMFQQFQNMGNFPQMPGMPGMGGMPGMPGMGGMPGMPGMPGMGGMPGMPGMPDMSQFSGMSMAPFQFWMQAAEAWQKNYASAMTMWSKGTEKK